VAQSAILTDLGAMRAALRAAMERLVDTRQRAAIETLLADDRAAFSFTEPGYPFHYARIDTVFDAACPRCSTRCRPGRRTTWGHCSCWPRPVRVG